MAVSCHSTWCIEYGAQGLESILRLNSTEAPLDAGVVRLRKLEQSGPCTVVLCGAQQQGYKTLKISSSSRLCEVFMQRNDDAAPSYVTSVRAQEMVDGGWYQAVVPLQEFPPHDKLHLRLLSLAGDKDTCKICSLELLGLQQQPQQQQQQAVQQCASGVADASGCSSLDPVSASRATFMSQMDELRLLNDRIASTDTQTPVPDSLKLLMDKALQQPCSASASSASTRALSAQVAHGAISRHRAQLQQQQQKAGQAGLHAPSTATGPQPTGQPTSAAAHAQLNSNPAVALEASHTARQEVVLQAISRLESKLDNLIERVSVAMQLYDARLTALESGCSICCRPNGSR